MYVLYLVMNNYHILLWYTSIYKSKCLFRSMCLYTSKCLYTVKPVLRGHPRKNNYWLLKTGDPLIQVHLHCLLVQGTKEMLLLKTGDLLIEVTT